MELSAESYVFVGRIVSPKSLTCLNISHGYLSVINGMIMKTGTEAEFLDQEKSGLFSQYKIIRLTDSQFLMPGFVDCHTHAPQFPNIGVGLDKPLLEWLDKYTFPMESQYGNIKFAANVYDQVLQRLLLNGTTTVCYFGTLHLEGTMELVKAAVKYNQRALIGKVSMNIENGAGYFNETSKELEDVESFVKSTLKMKNDLVQPVVTPRFAVSCDKLLMTGLAEISEKYSVGIQTHISENSKEIELVLEMNPQCSTYTDVYDESKLLNRRCILAHAVHLSEAEMRLLASKGVSIAHCPASNTCLRSGLCPVRQLLQSGLKVGLGTDVSGGNSASMLDAARRAMDVSAHLELRGDTGPALQWTEAFYLATLGGAEALNLDHKTGSLDAGKYFDALVVDVFSKGGPIDCYQEVIPRTNEECSIALVQRFFHLGDDRNIKQVYVQGKLVKPAYVPTDHSVFHFGPAHFP